MPKIIDVIHHQTAHGTQVMLVLDEMPKRIYKRTGKYFIANDGGFYDFLAGDGSKGDAFGGREFSITLDDGTEFQCRGNVWSSGHGGLVTEKTVQVGISTIAELAKCHVFSSASVSQALIDDWLSVNTPTPDLHKYDPRYSLEWVDAHYTAGTRVICKKRARVLRRRGVKIFRSLGLYLWCPWREAAAARILAHKAKFQQPKG